MNHNSLIYQDRNAYRKGRKDGYDEIMSKMRDIIDKCYNTGYKDAMYFVCEWMINFKNGNGEFPLYDFVGNLRKAMIENLCKGI